MNNQEHKNTWNGFTKLVLFGTVAVISLLVILAITLLQNFKVLVGSIKENISLEKRVAITPETAKNIISLGLKINLEKNSFGKYIDYNSNEDFLLKSIQMDNLNNIIQKMN